MVEGVIVKVISDLVVCRVCYWLFFGDLIEKCIICFVNKVIKFVLVIVFLFFIFFGIFG